MKFLRHQLDNECHKEKAKQDQRTDCIANVHSHRQEVAACFAQCGGAYFHDPKIQGHLRDLIHGMAVHVCLCHLVHSPSLAVAKTSIATPKCKKTTLPPG